MCVYIYQYNTHHEYVMYIIHEHINIMNIKKGISMIDSLCRTNDCLYKLYNKETITT